MITLLFGPMFSGKTTSLLAYERRFLIAKKHCILIKWSGDNRYTIEDKIITHGGISNTKQAKVYNVTYLSQLKQECPELEEVNCILIDEGQFFPDLVEFVKEHMHKKSIIISGLSGDYMQRPFKVISDIIPLATEIVHVKSICTSCGKDAAYTIRISTEQEQTIVGADDKYQPRCLDCL